jgi:hypothetical protein
LSILVIVLSVFNLEYLIIILVSSLFLLF